VVTDGAERFKGVNVGIEAAASDEVAAGGGISARPNRARSGPASRNEARICSPSAGSTELASTSAPQSVSSFSPCQRTSTPRPSRISRHRIDVANARHVGQHQLGIGQHRGSQDRQRTVLVAGGHNRSAERCAALNDELLHRWCQRPSLHRSRPLTRPGSASAPLGMQANVCSAISLARSSHLYGSIEPFLCCYRHPGGRSSPFHPISPAPYEHMFWRTTHRRLPSAPCTARATSPVPLCSSSRRSKTPTSSSLRARSTRTVRSCVARRRGSDPERWLARPQHCITPLVRSAPCSRELAGRR